MDHVRDLDLRLVIFGGEALDLGSLKPWFDRHGDQHPRLVNMYGITETTVHVTYRLISIADLAHRGSPIGEPIGDLEIFLLDAYQQPVPFGVAGEIYVGGAGVSRGYLNRPELTDERFVAHPFSSDPNARLYRSGDLARSSPDGGIEYLGRIDHQVQIRGFRVELGEIESVLKSHPQVRDALVSYEQSTGSGRLLAYLIPTLDEIPDATELRGYLKSRLPEYMLPAAFLAVTAFPLTPNGKIDTQALPLPDNSRREDSVRYESPRTELERTIVDVWKQVLQVTTLSIHDNVFDLGAHSLHIVQVHQRLKGQFGGELAVVELFRHPTIASLSQLLSANHNHATSPSAVEKVAPRVEQQRQARQRRQKEGRLRK